MLAVPPLSPPPEEPGQDVLERAVAGDRDAQGVIAAMYYARMRRWALLETGRVDLADEAVQEALVRWIRFAHTYRMGAPFTPWMRSLVRNASRDAVRPRGVLRFLPRSWRPSMERQIDVGRSARRALDAMQRLTPRQRALVDRVDVQGHTAAEAARELGISPATARVHLHEGRKRLKSALSEEEQALFEEAK